MNKIITAGCMAVATFAAVAVPTKTELERARPVVENVTKADLAAYKAGEKTAQKVAAAHIDYAQKAEGEAAKYLLYQGAFKLYARSGEYDLAAEAISAMKRDIKDLPPAVIVEIVSDELRYVSDDKAPRLVALLKEMKGAVSATGTKAFDGAVANGTKLNYEVRGDGVVIGGVWKLAVPTNTTGALVIPESINGKPVREIGMGAFAGCRGITAVTIPSTVTNICERAFKYADCYCDNLTSVKMLGDKPSCPDGTFNKCTKLTEIHVPANAKSWAGMKEWQGKPLVFDGVAKSPTNTNSLYCVIDISGGANAEHYPVSFLDTVPKRGWGDEHKTEKIVLRRIDAGTYPTMIRRGVNRQVTFTKPFYIGVFELTQKQIKLLTGERKFVFEGDLRPADCLCYEEMRGKDAVYDYPKTKDVAPDSIIGKLRAKTGISQIDLPTSYQFGCAWNAGTDGRGCDARSDGRHFSNQRDGKGGFKAQHTTVGSYLPNEWGIYDLHDAATFRCGTYFMDRTSCSFAKRSPNLRRDLRRLDEDERGRNLEDSSLSSFLSSARSQCSQCSLVWIAELNIPKTHV